MQREYCRGVTLWPALAQETCPPFLGASEALMLWRVAKISVLAAVMSGLALASTDLFSGGCDCSPCDCGAACACPGCSH